MGGTVFLEQSQCHTINEQLEANGSILVIANPRNLILKILEAKRNCFSILGLASTIKHKFGDQNSD